MHRQRLIPPSYNVPCRSTTKSMMHTSPRTRSVAAQEVKRSSSEMTRRQRERRRLSHQRRAMTRRRLTRHLSLRSRRPSTSPNTLVHHSLSQRDSSLISCNSRFDAHATGRCVYWGIEKYALEPLRRSESFPSARGFGSVRLAPSRFRHSPQPNTILLNLFLQNQKLLAELPIKPFSHDPSRFCLFSV